MPYDKEIQATLDDSNIYHISLRYYHVSLVKHIKFVIVV